MEGNIALQLRGFLNNPLFLSALASWLISQVIKTAIGLASRSIYGSKALIEALLWKTGGMPSSHSALVSAVTTSIAFKCGISSDFFIFSCCFSLIVIRDSMGVRRSSGQQAKVLNELGRNTAEKLDIDFSPVKETHGHRPVEVVVGLLLGFMIGVAFSAF